ncbi:MAG: hypothetical protein R2726_16555 [Acidimicrobiales bacterium]
MDVRIHETALHLLGAHAELTGEAPDAIDGGSWMKGYQFSLSGPIYAGTNEDPAQHRRRAGARPAEAVATCGSPSPTTNCCSGTPC